ncbi:MAG: tetratricopeptide repeat protein [Halanaerobiales bacterium]|nr:tetratricopeptide repeat protein [Halanaerobiales bacterium]
MKNNKFLIILLLLVFTIFSGLNVNAQESDLDLLTESIKNYHQDNFQEALDLNNKINLENLNAEAQIDTLYYRTLIQLGLGNISKGRKQLQELNDMGYDFGMIHYELGRIYLNTYNNFDNAFYQTALEQFKKARSLGINSPNFHRDFASAYIGVNNKQQAVQELEKALSKNATLSDYLNIANLHKELNNLEKAAEFYRKALEMDDQNSNAYSELGDVLINQNNYQEAIEVLNKGVENNPDSLILNYKLGQAYYHNNNYEQAEKYLLKAVDIKQNYYRAHFHLGKLYQAQEKYQNAKYHLNETVKYNPDYAEAYITLGDINLKQENNYQAIAQYSIAIEKNPNYPDGHFHLALAYYQSGMKEAAISELRKTLHLSDNHERARKLLDQLQEEE